MLLQENFEEGNREVITNDFARSTICHLTCALGSFTLKFAHVVCRLNTSARDQGAPLLLGDQGATKRLSEEVGLNHDLKGEKQKNCWNRRMEKPEPG